MTSPVLWSVLFFALLVASWWDLKTREVPDTLSQGLIVLGLLGGIILGLLEQDLWRFVGPLSGLLAGAAVGFLMYYARQWGGGDAKLLMGVGAILGLSQGNLLLIEYVVLLILLGAAYGLAWSIALAVRHRKQFGKKWKEIVRGPRIHKLRIALVATGAAGLLALLLVPIAFKLLIVVFLFGLYAFLYSFVFMRALEQSAMIKRYPVKKLMEGDWLAEPVRRGKKVLVEPRGTGLSKKDLAMLHEHKVQSVLVREGIPFVPSFLLALLALLLIEWQGWSLLTVLG